MLGACLVLDQPRDELRPLNPGLDLDEPALAIEVPNPSVRLRVEEDRATSELLAAHGVAATAHANGFPRGAGVQNCAARVAGGPDHDDPVDDGGVEARVDVVDDHACGRRLAGGWVGAREGASHGSNVVASPERPHTPCYV